MRSAARRVRSLVRQLAVVAPLAVLGAPGGRANPSYGRHHSPGRRFARARSGQRSLVDGSAVFGTMIWLLYIRFIVPVLGVFTGPL